MPSPAWCTVIAAIVAAQHAAAVPLGAASPSAPPPPPSTGSTCDLSTCECDGVSLSSLRGKTYHPPVDAEGYAYMISVCDEIPKDELPSGCQQYAEHPAVVKYKADNPADCIEIGAVGPCSQGECGMTGTAQPHGGLELVYTYTYGCKNTFTLTMTPASAATLGQVTSNECSYTATWAGLGPPPPPATVPLAAASNTDVAPPSATSFPADCDVAVHLGSDCSDHALVTTKCQTIAGL